MHVASSPSVVSVNVGVPRSATWQGRRFRTAIWKDPVAGPVALAGANLQGDDQADRRVHGGPDKAVYAYSVEDYEWWSATRGALEPGTFGENLTTQGIDLGACAVGDRWRVGTALLEVAQPREPCFKLAMRMDDVGFPDAFEAAGRPGAYLRIVEGGVVAAGDAITVEAAAAPSVTIRALALGELDDAALERVIADERVPAGWRKAAARARRR
jgi:MOSC domain-containing protein YiiM